MMMMMVTMNVCDDDCYLVMEVILVKEVMSCDVSPVFNFNSNFVFLIFNALLYFHLEWVDYSALPLQSNDEHGIDRSRDCHVLRSIS